MTEEHYDPTARLLDATRASSTIIRSQVAYLEQVLDEVKASVPEHQHAEGDGTCLFEARLSLVDSFARMVGALTRTFEEMLTKLEGDHDAPERVVA